jgi:hypothetical protein
MNETTRSWLSIEETESDGRSEWCTGEAGTRGKGTVNEVRSSTRVNESRNGIFETG